MTLWKSFTLLHQPPGCSSSPPASWLTLLYNILREWLKSPSHFLRWTWWPPPGGSEDSLEQGLKFTWSHLVSFSASVEVTVSENLLLGCPCCFYTSSDHTELVLNVFTIPPKHPNTRTGSVLQTFSEGLGWGRGITAQNGHVTSQVWTSDIPVLALMDHSSSQEISLWPHPLEALTHHCPSCQASPSLDPPHISLLLSFSMDCWKCKILLQSHF